MRPGKPLAFGNYKGVPLVGLPGNPVSSFVGFEVFLRPAINHMGGVGDWSRLRVKARLTEEATSDGRESYLRAIMQDGKEGLEVKFTGHQGSGNLLSVAQSNCLVIIPAGVKLLNIGDAVDVWPLIY